MRIGILGGTFDPPHNGHLSIAKAAAETLELDEVILLPASKNPFKEHLHRSSPEHRLKMVQAMIADEPGLAVSDMEITRGGVSYTVDTLGELQMVRPADYWFILGADAVRGITEWRNPQRLLRLCRLAVAIRPPITETQTMSKVPDEYRDRIDLINMPPLEISSSEIRERIRRGQNANMWVSPAVAKYIQAHKLYRD